MCHTLYINVWEPTCQCVIILTCYTKYVRVSIKCTGVETIMSHYTLGWHDNQNKHFEIGEDADDAWEAVRHAREDVPYLHEHPFSLDSIKKED